MEKLIETIKPYALHAGLALAILVCGCLLAWIVRKSIEKALTKGNSDPMVTKFVSRLLYAIVAVLAIAASLGALGVQTASIAAAIGAAGIAIGLALQNSLSNLASGLMLVTLKPFRAGDYIEGAGQTGSVDEVGLFATMLKTFDGRRVIVPNSKLTDGNIVNYASFPTRRMDVSVSVAYSSNLAFVKERLTKVIADEVRILTDPAPGIAVDQLADSGINISLKLWVKREDYWPVRFTILEKIKNDFDANGIEIPFPQRVVHIVQGKN